MLVLRLVIILCLTLACTGQYEANWDSIDSRPLPVWYDQAKIGILVYWGVYSVPSFLAIPFDAASFWEGWINGQNQESIDFMQRNYRPGFTYQDFAAEFTGEFFNPDEWADLFHKAGAKYVVLTSKHQEGFALWPTQHAFGWNAKDVGPNRDLVGDLATAVRNKNLHFGLYYSLLEVFNPAYLQDQANNWTTSDYVDKKVRPQLLELINDYQPDILWSDGDWDAPDTYWRSTEFLAWLYNESPVKETVVVNDRWGIDTKCLHGGFLTCSDRYMPGELTPYKWENVMPVDYYSWGYRRQINVYNDVTSVYSLIMQVVKSVSLNGNILISVGARKDGTIDPIFQDRLLGLGAWLAVNGEAIYETAPWDVIQNDNYTETAWYTSKPDAKYVTFLRWPTGDVLTLGGASSLFADPATTVTLLGNPDLQISWRLSDRERVEITLPGANVAVVVSTLAWSLKIV